MNRSNGNAAKSAIEPFIRQLIQLRDEKAFFISAYFPDPGSRRTHIDKLLVSYCGALDELIDGKAENRHPIVLIGSSVTVTYMEDGLTDTFTIVMPDEADPEQNRISLISPIAEQLLLRSQGDVLSLETNMGVLHVRIDRITPNFANTPEREEASG